MSVGFGSVSKILSNILLRFFACNEGEKKSRSNCSQDRICIIMQSMFKEDTNSCVHHPFDGVMEESDKKDRELDATKAILENVREENEKLKLLLSTILTDYNSLQKHVSNVLHQQHRDPMEVDINEYDNFGVDISLRLGRTELEISRKDEAEIEKFRQDKSPDEKREGSEKKRSGLRFRFQRSEDPNTDQAPSLDYLSSDVRNESAKKVVKAGINENQQEVIEMPEQAGLKKIRVCVKASCEDPSINDGCQWRKYGQKTARTNPLPRAYYRCSMSNNCPVRKQVQRCGEEETSGYMSTYEGTHDHPLPVEATHMAAGTCAAASVLQSGSSSSASLNCYFPFHQFSVSTTNSHPTVTLDLTQPNYLTQLPEYPLSSASLSFSSNDPPPPWQSQTLSFSGLRSQEAPVSRYSQMAGLARLSGQE